MANPKHVEKLNEGVEAWNVWRKKHRSINPDLSGISITRARLSRGTRGIPDQAELSRANFSWTSFREAHLLGVDLSGANLKHALLTHANLLSTILEDADLSEASLRGTNLTKTHLSGANFYQVDLDETVFANVDLSKIKNLDKCRHLRPSTLDIRTLSQSSPLPLSFLRGCGLSNKFIEFIPSLFQGDPIQFYSCFISYSSKDEDFAKRLHADLQDNGVRCWFAPEDMKIGDKIRQRIDESIKVYDKLMIILSENSIQSNWVEDEVESAIEKENRTLKTVLFPIRVDQSIMETDNVWAAKIRRGRHMGDFSQWKDHDAYQVAFKRLLKDLKEEAPTKPE